MICFSCGEILSEDLAYCTNCGRPLETETVIRTVSPAPPEPLARFEKFAIVTSWAAKNLILALIATAVLLGGFLLIVGE